MADSIGSFSFIGLHGSLELPSEKVLPVVRPGVDGVALWKMGRPAEPIRLRSVVDCQDINHGRSVFLAYQNLIGSSPVVVVKDGINIASWNFAVLDVRMLDLRAITGAVGAVINSPSGALLNCEWILMAISST